jgi:hypothetical protein
MSVTATRSTALTANVARCPPGTDRRGLDGGTVREDLGDWTAPSAFAEHCAYAGSTAEPCTISLQPG